MNKIKSATKVITLALLHPFEGATIQSWSFENKSPIRVGRSQDNDVVLISSVVSRHHLEIIWQGNNWKLVNLGVNGTYLGSKRIEQIRLEDGMILRLASSGPRIEISIAAEKYATTVPLETSQPQDSALSSATEKETMISKEETKVSEEEK